VKFFHHHSAIAGVEVQSETDRYIAWPGQALGYKVGQLTILRLRGESQEALGDFGTSPGGLSIISDR